MNKFRAFNPYHTEELYAQRGTIVDLKHAGYTIKEITEMAAEKVTEDIEFIALMSKVKGHWDNWLRANKSYKKKSAVAVPGKNQVEVVNGDIRGGVNVDKIDMDELKEKGFVSLPNPYNGKDGLYNNKFLEATIVTKDGSLLTQDMLLRAFNLDPMQFEIVDFKPNFWESQRADGTKLTMCQSKLRVRPTKSASQSLWEDAFKESISEIAKNHAAIGIPAKAPEPGYGEGSELAICAIADLHFGKLGFKEMTGEDYNSDIAQKRFEYIIDKYVEMLKGRKNVAKILFYWCQDFFHYDNKGTTTTAGTKQDSDLVWPIMMSRGFNMLVKAIYRLEEIAPVETMYVASNHDEHTGFQAAFALQQRFQNAYKVIEKEDGAKEYLPFNVTVNAEPCTQKYYRWGNGLYGFAHGDKEGKRIAYQMQNKARKAWGLTCFHEWFLGHFHSEHCKDEGGVKLRYLGSPTGTDNWHSQSGYCGAQKEAYIFIRDKKYGPVADIPIILSNYEMQEPELPEYEGWVATAYD